jgi:hypothetical protein
MNEEYRVIAIGVQMSQIRKAETLSKNVTSGR